MGDSRGSRDGQKAPGGAKDGSASRSRDWLVPLLLLCVRDEGSYDSRLQEKLGELGLDGTGPEEMYRTLWKMEREGMVVCNRDGSGFKIPRRWYEITSAGRAYLDSWADSLGGCQGEIDLFLKTYADGSAREAR
jgi:PadR family transcriptional regulator, regulatory protein PadR